MSQYISLSLSDLSLTILDNQIGGDRFPRLKAEQPQNQRSAYGNFVGYGHVYEPPHIFAFSAYLSWDQWLLLDALYMEYDRLRRARVSSTALNLLLTDTTAQFQERAPQTRHAAPAPWSGVTSISAYYISYYAQFYVQFTQRPEFSRKGAVVEATIALEETDRKVAP